MAPPKYWFLFDAETGESQPKVVKQWGFAAAAAGRYVLKLRLAGQSEVAYAPVEVREGEISSVAVDTGVELSGRTPQDAAPGQWILRDADTEEESTKVWRRWGFAAVPPGQYVLSVKLPGQSEVAYAPVEVREGEISSVAVDTGVELSGGTPQDVMPKQWILRDADTEEEVTKVWRRWGFAAAPPGHYSLTVHLPDQTGIEYAGFDVLEGQVRRIQMDTGIELVAGSASDVTPKRWHIYDAESERLITTFNRGWGRVWVPPGQYVLSFDSDQVRSGKSDVIELSSGDIAEVTLDQFGLGAAPYMETLRPDEKFSGFNIALAELGGKIESATSPGYGRASSAEGLIDGLTYVRDGRRCRRVCGWASTEKSPFPHEFVISFYRERAALISAVALEPIASGTIANQNLLPRHVEIWASMTGPNTGFKKIAAAQMRPSLEEQVIEFPPTAARYVKLRILSNHGGRRTSLGEVKIMEADSGPSILDDAPRDLARPENGGVIIWFTSQGEYKTASQLLWQGDWYWGKAWNSASGPYGPASYLPQDVVFAFRGDREALVDRLVVDPTGLDLSPNSSYGALSLARKIAVFVSSETPLDGFEKAGEFILEPEARPQSFPIGRRARFVKLRILETHGADWVKLGRIQLIEDNAPGYTSILKGLVAIPEAYKPDVTALEDETGLLVEREPNDTPPQANPLEIRRWTRGTVDPLGEEDHFQIPVSGDVPAMLTMGLKGRPDIRASVTFTDPEGRTLYRFDPGRTPARETEVSLQVQPGDHSLKVTQPINSIVLIWDTSGSMEGRLEDLREAILSYLNEIQPTERLNLIRFDEKPEVLLQEFTSDRSRLLAAVDGKFELGGGTALYDAIEEGIKLLGSAKGNRALVVMTDGEDDGSSELDHAGFWKLLGEKRVRIYTVGLGKDMKLYSRTIGSSGERFLGHVALATNGRAFFAERSEDLKGLYQQIADDLRAISPYYLKPELGRDPGRLSVVSTGEVIAEIPPRFELILDASGSMRGKLGKNETKIAVAKSVMKTIIDELPGGSEVALRVYGHRVKEYDRGDCEDSQLLFSFQTVNKGALDRAVDAVRVKSGTTPLSYSLVKAAQDLADTPGHKIIVLVTDGEEYCGAVPHEVAEKLAALGMKLRVDVVGFALADPAVKEEMIKAVKASGGSFHDAQNPESLSRSIRQALAPSYDVLDSAGKRVGGGVVGRGPIELAQGVYTVVIQAGGAPIEFRDVRIVQDKATEIRLEKQGQEIGREWAGPAASADAPWAAEVAAQPLQDATPASAGGEPASNLHAALAELEREVLAAIVNRPQPGSRRTASSGGPDPKVLEAQRQLAALGFNPGPADGQFGGKTARAVLAFQKWYPPGGLTPSGKLDEATYRALGQAVAEGMSFDAGAVTAGVVTSGPAPATLEGEPLLLNTARLRVEDRAIRLYGVEGVGGEPVAQMRRFIREQGGWVRCRPQTEAAYVCRTRGGIDVAEAALLNGAARAKPGAPEVYRRREQAAREAGRGVWAQ
ncbi:MAG: VWA domain-containing protein [Gammaproteobacteria bacterium]|nr:VWA domain-containing protein [Gammaproteobacteria bacterium]NIR85615.1 VWA domain-containing protein [Gammaproteobacteria bacterium]NIU06749.1 VWA domain-containing protein [Gammaproteobacteria bacterium]NIV53682.1 VWA domain-containing protein [Gammaproteobacteria bacterium]NIV75404.1 VWA domain-containing protein [Gammaproteobacteria bacterium]